MKKKIKIVPREKWLWMPHAGHFIMGSSCRFHLNTKVGNYIVSTVGDYWPDSQIRKIHAQIHDPKWLQENSQLMGDYWDAAYFKRFGYEEIGLSRTHETMVFRAIKDPKNACCPFQMTSGEKDFRSYSDGKAAREGHYQMCVKWAKK